MSDILPLNRPVSESTPVPLIDLVEQYQSIKGDVQAAVDRVFESQGFVLGEEVSNFEHAVAEYVDAREAIGCASGTDALILAMMALDVGPGDEVITTPYSFFATASCITRVGATPVFVDIKPDSYNLNPEAVEAAITSRTKAILPVHLYGQCAEMDSLWRIAVRHGLPIVEDAAQAIGAAYQGRRAGVLGQLGCFSFFPTKNLGGAGDGGIMTTDDPELATRLKRLRVHGDVGGYNHVEVGFNSRLDALQAAVLRVKLRHLDDWTTGRQKNAQRYEQIFAEQHLSSCVEPPAVAHDRRHVYNQYTLRIGDGLRDTVMEQLRAQGIGCAVYYPIPLHMQKCFEYLGYQPEDFPESVRAASEVLSLPIFAELTDEQLTRVATVLTDTVARTTTLRFPAQKSERRAA